MKEEIKELIKDLERLSIKENKSNFVVTFHNKPILTFNFKKSQKVFEVKNNLEKETFEIEKFDAELFKDLIDYCVSINTPVYWLDNISDLPETEVEGFKVRSRGKSDDFIIRETLKSRVYKKADVQPEDRWLDVGGNIGMFCLFLESKGCKNSVIFEPEKVNFELMKLNLSSNGIETELVQKAVVGSGVDTVSFFMGTTPYDYSLIKKNERKKEIIVQAENINDIIEKYDIDCLKLDCEGAEYEIIKAITPENFKKLRKIIGEYHFDFLDDVGVGTKYFEIMEILKEHFEVEATDNVKQLWNTNFFAKKI